MTPYGLFRALSKLGVQKALNWTARVQGMNVPLLGTTGGEALSEISGASWKLEFFRRLRALGDVPFVDAGANVGQTLLQYARCGTIKAPYLAFEPNSYCAHYLSKLVEANGLSTVDVYPCALHSTEGFAILEMARDHDASASIMRALRPGRSIRTRQRVVTFSLDYLRREQLVSLSPGFVMKIDVEGAEAEVVKGALATLEEMRPIIQCEVLWAHGNDTLERVAENNAQLVASLNAVRYGVYRLLLDREQTTILGIEAIDRLPSGVYKRGTNSHECEYLFLPAERADQVRSIVRADGV